MQAKLVQMVDGAFVTTMVDEESLIAAMEIRGYRYRGVNTNTAQRVALQGKPKFDGVLGPMWDDGNLRYECPETYAALSAD